MPSPARVLVEATQRVKALRKSGLSVAKIAATAGVTSSTIATVLKKGARKTRGKNKQRLLAWVAKAGDGAAPSAARNTQLPSAGHVTIVIDGRTIRLAGGEHYLLLKGRLLQRL